MILLKNEHKEKIEENFKEEHITYYENEQLQKALLKNNTTIRIGENEIEFTNNCHIEFYQTGGIKKGYLNGDHRLIVNGEKTIKFVGAIVFYEESQRIKQGHLPDAQIIEGKRLYGEIHFHENGRLKRANLSNTKQTLYFDQDGNEIKNNLS